MSSGLGATALSESEQDANVAGTYEARPGNTDDKPAGVSPQAGTSLSSAVKEKLDAVVGQAPSTQSVSEQLPSAQTATDALKSGASALVAGVSSLALGVSNAATQNASDPKSENRNTQDVDDLHVPGAFEDETNDREDIAEVRNVAQSAYNSLPSRDAVSEYVPSGQSIKEKIPNPDQIKQQLPDLSSGNLPSLESQKSAGQQRDVRESRLHKEGTDYIKDQLFSQQNPTINSVSAQSTTNQLAGQVPLEPRGVPQIVADSQRQAGQAAPLDLPASNLASGTTTAAQLTSQAPANVKGVPEVVTESQREAGQPPEASANAEVVQVKQELERELQQNVPEAGSSATQLGQSFAESASALGAVTARAVESARQKTQKLTGTDPVSILPESAQKTFDPNTGSKYPRVVGISQPGNGNENNLLQQGGIKNTVVGAGSSDLLKTSQHGTASSFGAIAPTSGTIDSAGVTHITSTGQVDLSAGIKNTVTGSGAEEST